LGAQKRSVKNSVKMRIQRIRDFFISRCCKASYKSVITNKGKVKLCCEECGECCGILEKEFKNIDCMY